LHQPGAGYLSIAGGNRVAYVFQEPRLLPWKTALDNVTYVMGRDQPAAERRDRAMALLEAFEIAEAATLHPDELSGGMARRVGIARALASPSDLLLMDEPFASLDIQLKKRLLDRLVPTLRDYKGTVLIATHDIDVAAALSDRVILLSKAPVEVVEDISAAAPDDQQLVAGPRHPVTEPEHLKEQIEAGLERHGSSLEQLDEPASRKTAM
jgi:NitT/TauT family transport system ATP-binding protein